jgi:hypothetical protein
VLFASRVFNRLLFSTFESTLLLFATTTVSGIVIKHYYLVDDVTAISASFLFSPFSPFTLPR